MTLDLGRPDQHLLLREGQLEEVVGGEEAGDDRRGAGAEPARQRDLAAQPEGDAVGGMQGLEGAHDQVVAPGRDVEPAGIEARTRRVSSTSSSRNSETAAASTS